jgi:hypothetical protein
MAPALEVSSLVRFNKMRHRQEENIQSEAFGFAQNVENLNELWSSLPP